MPSDPRGFAGAGPRAILPDALPDNRGALPYMSPCASFLSLPCSRCSRSRSGLPSRAWVHLGGDAIPFYGYVAIVGGVLFSLLVGGGLMALVFYSNRHGYDDLSGGNRTN